MGEAATHAAIEAVASHSHGRLVAYLAARTGDIAGAEDALSDAFSAALRRWPSDGVPDKPEAWLLRAARNRLIDAARHSAVRQNAEPLLQLAAEAEEIATARPSFPDKRLELLLVCAHPAIESSARTPLMLQTVLGLGATRIASAFLVSPAAMEQRLVRAKTKIRDARIPFRVPEPPEWEERISFVLDAIYSAYTAGWTDVIDDASIHQGLSRDALEIARTLVQLMPDEPEARGLFALMLHVEARRAARCPDGRFVPLDRQDTTLWSQAMITEAETQLRIASGCGRIGRYQLEAAIQSIHAHRAISGKIDWPEIALLYEGLVGLSPTTGAHIGRAVALAESGQVAEGLAALDALPTHQTANYQPWWAARAHLLRRLGRHADALKAFERAASLTTDPAVRVYLLKNAT